MKKNSDNSVTLNSEEFKQLVSIFNKMHKMADAIPSQYVPTINSADLVLFDIWRHNLNQMQKMKIKEKDRENER